MSQQAQGGLSGQKRQKNPYDKVVDALAALVADKEYGVVDAIANTDDEDMALRSLYNAFRIIAVNPDKYGLKSKDIEELSNEVDGLLNRDNALRLLRRIAISALAKGMLKRQEAQQTQQPQPQQQR